LLNNDFQSLGDEFCSIGKSLDYYERLNALGDSAKTAVLTALRDVVQLPELIDVFRNEEGWETSLFRDEVSSSTSFINLARGLITGDYKKIPSESMSFSFDIPGWSSAVEFQFDGPEISDWLWDSKSNALPERIAVLVGRNGSGKSTLLARLARVAFGNLEERSRPPLSRLGSLEPSGVGFPRIITVAFSPFDSFKLPGSDGKNLKQVIKDMERGEGRFSFIGLRDVAGESNSRGTTANSAAQDDNNLMDDRLGMTRLKSIQELADEFAMYLEKVRSKDRQKILKEISSELFSGSAFQDSEDLLFEGAVESAKARFFTCSTGHKIALLIVVGLLANIEPYSLVLVDEPETHLHPPLLAALMHALRKILIRHEAFAIVATHSPVVVQESFAKHVRIVRREGETTAALPVTGETFGESIGLITAEVFGLQTDTTDFHKILDRLVELYPDIEKIENIFLNGAMSHQARAYVMSRLSAPKD
jgi:ABC-type lipoprotein export system ATPase subunit